MNKCNKCINKAVAWFQGNYVCSDCYNKLKSKSKISGTAMARLNARMWNEEKNNV